MKKFGLVLGSGGARGVAHVGFLQALEENGISPDIITGCSIGSIVGAAYLAGKTPTDLMKIAKMLKKNDIIDFNVMLYSGKALLKSQKMGKLIKKIIGKETFEELPKPFGCIATDLYTGNTHFFKSGDLVTAVKSSCSIPSAFPPVKFEDKLLIDGGINNRIPVKEARELGADVVIAVDILADPPYYEKIDNIIQLIMRTIDIMSDNVQRYLPSENSADLTICPILGKIDQYHIKNQQECYDAGYKAGIENMDKIKKVLEM